MEPQKKGDKIQKINDTKDRRLKTKKKVDEDLRQKNIEDIRLTWHKRSKTHNRGYKKHKPSKKGKLRRQKPQKGAD